MRAKRTTCARLNALDWMDWIGVKEDKSGGIGGEEGGVQGYSL